MPSSNALQLDRELDRLYQGPLDDFVNERNRIASELAAENRNAEALQVRALAKPPLSAWAVNQLYSKSRGEYDALMEAGRAMRETQRAVLAGKPANHLRDATATRDKELVAALQRSLELLQEAGHPATPPMRLRIATNLEALAAYAGDAPGIVPGRLTSDLDPPGFEVLASRSEDAAHHAQKPEKSAARQQPREKRKGKVVSFEAIAAARREVAKAEDEVAERRTGLNAASEASENARAEVTHAEAETRRLEAELETAREHLEMARRRVPDHEREEEKARRRLHEAAGKLERARAALERTKK